MRSPLLLLASLAVVNPAASADEAPCVLVLVDLETSGGVPELVGAMHEALRVLDPAGLSLTWKKLPRTKTPAACPHPRRTLAVQVAECDGRVSPPCRDGVLGTATSFANGSGHSVVYIEPIRAHAGVRFDDRIKLLGRVIAHEIVHLLAGPGAHCHAGLMSGSWSAAHIASRDDTSTSLSPELLARIRSRVTGSRLQPVTGDGGRADAAFPAGSAEH